MVSFYRACVTVFTLSCVFMACLRRSVAAPAIIHRAGECHKDMYLIAEVSLELRPKVDDDRAGAAVLGPRSAIGQMGFVNGFLATEMLWQKQPSARSS